MLKQLCRPTTLLVHVFVYQNISDEVIKIFEPHTSQKERILRKNFRMNFMQLPDK